MRPSNERRNNLFSRIEAENFFINIALFVKIDTINRGKDFSFTDSLDAITIQYQINFFFRIRRAKTFIQ